MQWVTIKDKRKPRESLPKYGSTFLALWKGYFCLACFDSEVNHFWVHLLPGTCSIHTKVDHKEEKKFTHYCILQYPEDYKEKQ